MKNWHFFIIIILVIGGVVVMSQQKIIQPQSDKSVVLPSEAVSTVTSQSCTGQSTPALTEGPYYKTGSPEKTSLIEAGILGEKITITGYVYDRDCKPIEGAWLDFWQADGEGNYDNSGYRLRGHQFTDSSGRYILETVIPGEYPGRTPHIHVKVRKNEESPILTTQLFFPGAAGNESDSIFDEELIVKQNNFNFVVE